MPKRFYKHKILLDENMPHRTSLPHLNSQFDVKHIRDDLHQDGSSDHEVYTIAARQGRIIVTQNWPDFLPLLGTTNDAGVIGTTGIDHKKIDIKLTALLKKVSPASLAGKYTSLNA